MNKKQKKVLKVVGVIVVVWLGIGLTNYLIHSKIVTSSKSNAQMQGPDRPTAPDSNGGGFGGGFGGGGSNVSSWWQSTFMGPLCWEFTDICW